MPAVELQAFEAGRCVVQDAGSGHEGEGAVGGEGGGLPAGGGGPGAADHMVGAAGGWLARRFGGVQSGRRRVAAAYVFMAITSGELGSGTGCGLGLRVKVNLEASSSARAVGAPLRVREGAVWAMACLTPESTSSETFWDCIAEGDMA